MVIKRTRDYEDLDESNSKDPNLHYNNIIPQEIEMASVAVVPDGIY